MSLRNAGNDAVIATNAEGDTRIFVFLRHLLSALFKYSKIIPFAFLDLAATIYLHICLRLYGIAQVSKDDDFVIDRQLLSQLSLLYKFNCVYCGYGNAVIAYAREIISQTEQYWYQLKHVQETRTESERYNKLLEYGDSGDYREKRESYREELRQDNGEDKESRR